MAAYQEVSGYVPKAIRDLVERFTRIHPSREVPPRDPDKPLNISTSSRLDDIGFVSDEALYAELAIILEDRFRINVDIKDTYCWRTVEDVTDYMEKRLKGVA